MVIGVIAAIGYGARFSGDNATPADLLFRWSTAIATFLFDGIILLLLLLIARGLPLRETFALRRPPSWPTAWKVAGGALAATYAASIMEEIVLGHGAREQAVPQFWDPTRADAFVANAIAIALFVPVVEEMACRGLGFRLLEAYGQRVAIVGSAVAFALARRRHRPALGPRHRPGPRLSAEPLGQPLSVHRAAHDRERRRRRCRGGPALRLVAGPKRADHLDEVAARIVEDGATRGDALALQDVRA